MEQNVWKEEKFSAATEEELKTAALAGYARGVLDAMLPVASDLVSRGFESKLADGLGVWDALEEFVEELDDLGLERAGDLIWARALDLLEG